MIQPFTFDEILPTGSIDILYIRICDAYANTNVNRIWTEYYMSPPPLVQGHENISMF